MSTPGKLVNKPAFLENEAKTLKILVMDAPTDENLDKYISVLKKRNVTVVVRACEPSYDTAPLLKEGIRVVELAFPDGDPPPPNIVSEWLSLIDHETKRNKDAAIAVHCVAGLGRAPALAAIAFIEDGMEPLDAISFIRKKRRGAINQRQIKYLESYKRRRSASCCIIC